MNNLFLKLIISIFTIIFYCIVSFGGQLGYDSVGVYYQFDDGSYAISQWVELDLDNDSYSEYYYFNSEGYLQTNGISEDGYQVNSSGQWVKDGKVQRKSLTTPNNNSQKENKISNKSINSQSNTAISKKTSSDYDVWIPNSGKKYHSKSSCSKMKNPRKVSVEEAKRMGYGACSKCW